MDSEQLTKYAEAMMDEFVEHLKASAPRNTDDPLRAMSDMERDLLHAAVASFHCWTRVRAMRDGVVAALASRNGEVRH